jgi:DNA-binding NarL/FixJ family response regulator
VTPLRVLIVAGDPLARAGLAALLAAQPGLAVAGQAAPGAELPAALEAYRPQALVWDLGWDAATALDALAALPEDAAPSLALLPDDTHAAAARAAGARGLLLRDASGDTLAAALLGIVQGLVVLDPALAGVVPEGRPPGQPPAPAADLTPRELEVLRLLAEGLPNKAIAAHLGISEHTVKFHVNSILGKLGAQSRTEAVARATRLGLVLL